jgi:hypothetical protein
MEYFEYASLALLASPLILVLFIWSTVWKGFALWRAVKNESKGWFIALLIVNTGGILEILYLFVFGKEKVQNSLNDSIRDNAL